MISDINNSKYYIHKWDVFDLIKKIDDNSIDVSITSPPYFMGKEYDTSKDYNDFIDEHKRLLPEIIRITKDWWSICWQVWYHVINNSIMPLDWLVYDVLKEYILDGTIMLRNRITWTFWHWFHNSSRFSWRHENVLWFTKWKEYKFDLDSVRVPQKYPGKKYSKWDKKWEYSWNPFWKNPWDVWDIPNVKSLHVEKTEHPCQFPVALVQRFVKALAPVGWIVFDPYTWSWSSWVASLLEWRKFIWAELDEKYYNIAVDRCEQTLNGTIKIREDKPIFEPDLNFSVARKPLTFKY